MSLSSAAGQGLEDPVIDLTSDTEEPSTSVPGNGASSTSSNNAVEILSPWALKMTAVAENIVKREGKKRAAEVSANAQKSGDVQVVSKPPKKMDEITNRPTKRSKGEGASSSAGAEDDLEMVGTTGTAKLPHNRFACTEHPFSGSSWDASHKEKCSLCYCYVCDRLASDCQEWSDHCHAIDSGPFTSRWKALRHKAKAMLVAGRRPPVSNGFNSRPCAVPGHQQAAAAAAASGSNWGLSASSVNSSSSSFGSPSGSSSSSSGGSSSSYRLPNLGKAPDEHLPNACNCEELCKPVHAVFRLVDSTGYPRQKCAEAPVVYLRNLTLEQVEHVKSISIKATSDREALKKYKALTYSTCPPSATILARYLDSIKPTMREVSVGLERFDVTVVGNSASRVQDPFKPKWKEGTLPPAADPAVRLGGVDLIKFKMKPSLNSVSYRQAHFDRFVSTSPMAESLLASIVTFDVHEENPNGLVEIVKDDDYNLLRKLKVAYGHGLVDIETRATFNANTNVGSFSIEVILLGKLFRRGMSIQSRTYDVDFTPIVEQIVLKKVFREPSIADKKAKKPLSAGAPAGPGCGAETIALGHQFTPSGKGYGGRASLDVSLSGLVDSVRAEESNQNIQLELINTPAKMLLELENLQHRSLPKQPDCLTVELYEHQKQDAQWMMDQELMKGGTMQHLWAELPPHPNAPAGVRNERDEFRRCWFSPFLNQFTVTNPFASTMKGGILCDEMGLGKTAATLCLHLIHPAKTPSPGVPLDEDEWGPLRGLQATSLSNNREFGRETELPGRWVSKGTLVVCKVSLVGQWVEEAKRLCGGALTIYPYHGGNRKKDPNFLTKYDMVVTTYGVVQADASRNTQFPPLRRIRWWRVVLDESHTIASTSSTAKVVQELIANRRWCMTGTPYISRFSDANGQLSFIGAEGAFKSFDLGDKTPNTSTQKETIAFMRRVLLRHSQGMKLGKKSILGLPTITHKVEVLTMPAKERDAYVEFEKGIQEDFVKVRHRLRTMQGSHTMEVLTLLSKFRQACSGGQLLVANSAAPDGALGASSTATVDAFCPICNDILEAPAKTPCGHTFCQACITSVLTKTNNDQSPCPKCKTPLSLSAITLVGSGDALSAAAAGGGSGCNAKLEPREAAPGGASSSSGGSSSVASQGVLMETKLTALVARLTAIRAKDPTSKSLVFSQFNSSLEWLKRMLPKKGFQFRTLTGSMSRSQRTAALSAFAKDPPTTVFLLSVRSGAVGINLTQANNVFLLEPLLNLALEKQAIGRVYRLGQSRPVVVTKLVLKNSIETRILEVQKKQAKYGGASAAAGSASNTVAGNIAKDNAKNLKIEEYNELFGVKEEKVAPPSSHGSAGKKSKKVKIPMGWFFGGVDEEEGDY